MKHIMNKSYSKFFALAVFSLTLGCNTPPSSEWDFQSFYKPKENPIFQADSSFTFTCPIKKEVVQWQKADVFNPAALVKDNKVYLFMRCEDNPKAILGGRTSRIGLAYSDDGIHFTKHPTPVLYPDNDEFMQYDYPGGCEDPRIVETEDGLYVMTYTSWNHKIARLSIAFSKDLITWEKRGLAFAKAHNGKFLDHWSKSGSIVTKMEGGKQIVAKINGKYWMYWGEHFVNLAWSDNLIDWIPLLNEDNDLKVILGARKNKFDSALAECGPPALINDEGIVLFYNGKNSDDATRDDNLPTGTYSVGKAVFDINNPEKVIFRSDTCLLKPTLPHEMTGQYKSGTVFGEGLVHFRSKWFLYYGTADSYIGVAVSR
ncbi:glycoside hydrolase family 130 protein [Ulvibacterium sp.]|uniref:glycoside hydrolase family 130 protein n=1 Tax=Ulvibacterium sp. TaxID=2665914 RepID=UPI003BA8E562